MPEYRTRNDKTEKVPQETIDQPVRIVEKDVTAQLADKTNDLVALEQRITTLQEDNSHLARLATATAQQQRDDNPLVRLGPSGAMDNLARFGLVPTPHPQPTPPFGSPPPIAMPWNAFGFGNPFAAFAPPFGPTPSGGEAVTLRDFSALPYATRQPGVNIVDSGDQYIVQVELPATKKKDLELLGSERSITVMAQVRPDPEALDGTVLVGECTPTRYRRTITLPSLCNTSKSRAQLKDGILTLNIPKKDPSNGMRRIDIAYG